MHRLYLPLIFCLTLSLLQACGAEPDSSENNEETSSQPAILEELLLQTDFLDELLDELSFFGNLGFLDSVEDLAAYFLDSFEQQLEALPQITLENQLFTDPNTLVALNAAVSTAEDASLRALYWEQITGPEVVLLNNNQANTLFMAPNVSELQQMVFLVMVVDSEFRINANAVNVTVYPTQNLIQLQSELVSESEAYVSVNVRLNSVSDDIVNVSYRSQDGSAWEGLDYIAVSGELEFLPGEQEKTVDILLLEDDEVETAETFTLQVSAIIAGETTSNTLPLVIRDNDTE